MALWTRPSSEFNHSTTAALQRKLLTLSLVNALLHLVPLVWGLFSKAVIFSWSLIPEPELEEQKIRIREAPLLWE